MTDRVEGPVVGPPSLPGANDPPSAGTTVWYCHSAALAADRVAAFDRMLSVDERGRRDRLARARDRRDFTAAHGLLRCALTRHGPTSPAAWRFIVQPGGKPAVAPEQAGTPPLAFNLAHGDGLVACAVVRGARVGIDVEHIDRVAASGIERYFSATDRQTLYGDGGRGDVSRLIELWTLKEAFVKAVGLGLLLPLDSFGFELVGATGVRFHPPPGSDASTWRFLVAMPCARSRIAVAIEEGRHVHRGMAVRELPPDGRHRPAAGDQASCFGEVIEAVDPRRHRPARIVRWSGHASATTIE